MIFMCYVSAENQADMFFSPKVSQGTKLSWTNCQDHDGFVTKGLPLNRQDWCEGHMFKPISDPIR